MKIGILGGSFNPIHNGHIALARHLLREAELDEVWLMVSPQNPLKRQEGLLDENVRLEMTRKALEGEADIKASDFEFNMPRPSYTYDTLRKLSEEYPADTFTLLIGADNWERFGQWRNSKEIAEQYDIVVYPRRGSTVDTSSLPKRVRLVDTPLYDISSTEVRDRISRGKDICGLVPPVVAEMMEREKPSFPKRLWNAILRLLSKVLLPIKINFAFFVFMFLVGYTCCMLEVPDMRGAKPYPLTSIELFFDLYAVCLILSFIPRKVRNWVRSAMYAILYTVSIVDMYCFVKFKSTLTPTMLLLVGETNSSEAQNFFSSYLDWDVFFSPVGLLLAILLVHICCSVYSSRRKTHPAIRRKLTGRWGRIYKKLTPSEKAKVSIGAAAGGILGAMSIWLLIDGWMETANNKQATARLMSYDNIGEVEHELTRKDRATLYLPIYRFAFSVYANELASKQLDRLIAGTEKVAVDSCSFRSPHIVFIMGESYNKHHSQLYGYNYETTPLQLKRKERGELTVFSDVVSCWNLTSFVFKNVFSLHAVGDSGEWCDYPLFPEVFRKAGYNVTFITNQFLPQAKEAIYDFSGGFFLNNPILSEAQFDVRNSKLHRLDGGMIIEYDRLKDSIPNRKLTGDNRLTIIHLMGQHTTYGYRYPKEYKRYHAKDYDWPSLSHKNKMILADYDNATLYNDYIIDELLKRWEDEDVVVVHMSDHGEEAFGDGMPIFGRQHSAEVDYRLAHEEFEVPFWIWCSKKYRRNHPDVVKCIKAAKDLPFMTDNLPHLLLYLAGIRCPDYRSDYNPLEEDYNVERPRILKGQVDYNKLKIEE
ncbi:MAG: nicotinate (nicotinamide) nucleotide adenylyltransferase [Prevotella sp.]